MQAIDLNLIEYLMSNATPETSVWIEDRVADYRNAISCYGCGCADVKVVVDTSIQVKCSSCSKYSTGSITLDKILPINYTAVKFLQLEKIIEILKAQGKI